MTLDTTRAAAPAAQASRTQLRLGELLAAHSPRRSPAPTPLASHVIHASVLALWILLLGAPFGLHGVWVWSAGLVYVSYDTLLLVFTFWQTLPLLRRTPSASAGAARGAGGGVGGRLIDTEVVLTVDADTLLEPDAIAAVRRAFAAEPHLVATTGVLTPVCADTASGRVFEWFQTYEYIRNFLARYAWMRLDSLLLISGAFAGFRRAAALEVGGFDPDCLVEDYELIHRLKRYGVRHGKGWTTRVLGGARARTEAPSTTLAFLRQRRRWFGGFLQTQFWYREMVGDRRYGALGLAMLPVKAVDTLQPLYGLTAFVLLCSFLAQGRLNVLAPVGGVIAAKIVLDFSFQLWAIHLYRCWVGDRRAASLGHALVASIIEPFSFQLLRHVGAAWGWAVFLRGRQTWGSQRRVGALR